MTRLTRAIVLSACVVMLLAATVGSAAQIDPKAVELTLPENIKWVRNAAGTQETAILFGDPTKPGPYVIRLRWLPNNMSRPHYHENDRFFVVISGTWWLGSGEKYDPNSTVPAKAGSYVYHHAKQVHYDGAKDEPTVIQVWGMGPATSIPAEKK
ncbi:MAG TPA: cupin domain-containing protein [Vicinamibacterales bacterium]|nr:cupin domain-containing protein [Vicinamibacterales bacterium]